MKKILETLKRKWAEYLLEIIVITIGILGAYALNNWNELRKEDIERERLISSLRRDFELNKVKLQSSIDEMDKLINGTELFLQFSQNPEIPISIDSLKTLADYAFHHTNFVPSLSTYNQAISTGGIRLISDPKLIEQLTDVNRFYDFFQLLGNVSANNFFFGGTWSIRQQIGNLEAIAPVRQDYLIKGRNYFDNELQLTDQEILEFVNKPIVFAGYHNQLIIYYNTKESLQEMLKIDNSILEQIKYSTD